MILELQAQTPPRQGYLCDKSNRRPAPFKGCSAASIDQSSTCTIELIHRQAGKGGQRTRHDPLIRILLLKLSTTLWPDAGAPHDLSEAWSGGGSGSSRSWQEPRTRVSTFPEIADSRYQVVWPNGCDGGGKTSPDMGRDNGDCWGRDRPCRIRFMLDDAAGSMGCKIRF